jgi:hypothetical protein
VAKIAKHAIISLKKPDWLLNQAEEVRITDGRQFVNLTPAAQRREPVSKVVYKGFMGDAMMGL